MMNERKASLFQIFTMLLYFHVSPTGPKALHPCRNNIMEPSAHSSNEKHQERCSGKGNESEDEPSTIPLLKYPFCSTLQN